LAARHQLPLELSDAFTEIGFGVWEGKTAQELIEQDPQRLYRFWDDPLNNTPPEAEALSDFHQRITGQWEQTLKQYTGSHLLIVGHAGMMRMILSHILGMPMDKMFRLQIPNAGISRIQVDHFEGGSLPRLLFHAGVLS
jgi:alpha-ribazole phosphatase/probable phosphoglycerate mutase